MPWSLSELGPRRPEFSRGTTLALQVATGIGILALWEGLSRAGVLDPFFYSSPSRVLGALAEWAASGTLLASVLVTLEEAVIGYVIGAVVGAVLGLVLGIFPRVGHVLDPFLGAFNAIPKMALVPLLILWLGLGAPSKIAAAALAVVILVFYSVYAGIRGIDRTTEDYVRLMGATRLDLFPYVYVPATLVWLVVGLRTSLGFAFSAALVAEYLGSESGLGHLILQGQSLLHTQDIFGGLVVSALIVVLLDYLLRSIERRASAWRL